ncbi:hypothetical protein HOY34_08280 [Xinfangfangia sp. D13-10-4-6]|uniref:hypothetical protein n=1 Tax=Pseudogemmobacter hezensis TaxID=2737662 RepID=UPI001557C2F7|nr:hypothetical protein [Pseudogemmobacter hezensis]NPD15195.1 hypothetical protein [Pseudogemmobacter hezensis]
MQKPREKALLWGLAGGAALLALAGAFGGALTFFTSGTSGTPKRVELLAGLDNAALQSGHYALILGDFVTASGPRLIEDPETLAQLAPSLWYNDESDAGSYVGSAIGLMMGAPPVKEIGVLLKDGRTEKTFTCLSINCLNWLSAGEDAGHWGMGGLRQQLPPSQPVELMTSHFENYDAYLIAHKSIAADPTRWFAEPTNDALQPPDDGRRQVYITLPSQLIALPEPAADSPPGQPLKLPIAADPKEVEALRQHAQSWIAGTDGEILNLYVSMPMPFWVISDGNYLYDEDGSRALPGLGWQDSTVTLSLPEGQIPALLEKIDTSFAAPPDMLRLSDAVHRSFVAWGLDADCLPGCGGVDTARIIPATDITVSPAPSWTIASWRLLP